MWLRLRQIALVANKLEPVLDDLCDTLGIEVCYRDPGVGTYGLENALMPIGTTMRGRSLIMMAASTPKVFTGIMVTRAQSSAERQMLKKSTLALSSRNSGRLRPAWRIIQTGV